MFLDLAANILDVVFDQMSLVHFSQAAFQTFGNIYELKTLQNSFFAFFYWYVDTPLTSQPKLISFDAKLSKNKDETHTVTKEFWNVAKLYLQIYQLTTTTNINI